MLGTSFFSSEAQAGVDHEPPMVAVVSANPSQAPIIDEVLTVEVAVSDVVEEVTVAETEVVDIAGSIALRFTDAIYITARRPIAAEVHSITVAASPVSVFPVVGQSTFHSDFGVPRPNGRTHQGNDIFADKGTAVVVVADGVVIAASDGPGPGCCFAKIEHDDGSRTVYLHLNNDTPGTDDGMGWGLADGIEVGARVEVGAVIGFVGDSGNAEDTTPHLHFEYHPPQSGAVDPYELLSAAPLISEVDDHGAITVEAEELPFTGPPSDLLTALAGVLLVAGIGLLGSSRENGEVE